MLSKDKVDGAEADLEAAKSERGLYIPRAVIKRPKIARLMPFSAASGQNVDADRVLFYVVLHRPPNFGESREM